MATPDTEHRAGTDLPLGTPPKERPRSSAPRARRVGSWFALRPAATVALVALMAASWAVLANREVFPYLTINHDEPVYLLQADALRHGKLFPPAPTPADAFLPWLSVTSGDHYVSKYAPVHPAVIALARTVSGTDRAGLALIAAGLVVMTYLLGKEVLGKRSHGVLASAFLALSPLFLIQVATFHTYATGLLLLETFAVLFLRGTRRGSARQLCASGFFLELAFFTRPYDAVLFGVPFGLWLVATRRSRLRRLVTETGWTVLGALPPLAAMLGYFWLSTGNALRSPFTLDPGDTFGFGQRRMLSGQTPLRFTPAEGWDGIAGHVLLTSFWGFGGLVLIGLSVVGFRHADRSGVGRWLALVALITPLGYLFWWGSYGAWVFGVPRYLGPYYLLPVLVPMALLGAKGFLRFWEWDRALAACAVVGMLASSLFVVGKALSVNLDLREQDSRLYSGLRGQSPSNAVVFLPQLDGPQLLHPFAALRNSASYDGKVIWASDSGDERNLEVLDAFPGRTPYRLNVEGTYGDSPPDPELGSALERLQVLRGATVPVDVAVRNVTRSARVVLDVVTGDTRDSYLLDATSSPDKLYAVVVRVGPLGSEVEGPVLSRTRSTVATNGSDLTFSVTVTGPNGEDERRIAETSVVQRQRGELVETLVPSHERQSGGEDQPALEVGPRG